MSENEKYDEVKKLGWELFSKTGDITYYGMVVSARELEKELGNESFGEEREM